MTLIDDVGTMTATWIDPDGVEWALSETGDSPGWFTTFGPAGWGAPPYEIVTDPLARGGANLRYVRANPSKITWPLHVWGATFVEFTQRYRDLRRAFISTLHKNTPGILRVQLPDGTAREILAYYEDGFTGQSGENWTYANVALTLNCPDGYWRDSVDTSQAFAYGTAGSFLAPYPQTSPSQVLGSTTVTNAGEVDAWPTWTVVGPMASLQAVNLTTGMEFNLAFALTAGQTLTITTDPPSVRGPGGQNLVSALDWPSAYLWPLVSGDNNVQFNLSGAAAGTTVTLTYRARYEGV